MTSKCEGPNHLLDFSDFKIGAHADLIIFSHYIQLAWQKKSAMYLSALREPHVYFMLMA